MISLVSLTRIIALAIVILLSMEFQRVYRGREMSGMAWLHLSDWHQGGKEFNREVMRDALIDDINKRTEIDVDLAKIDFIVFSGDLTVSGKPEEYETIRKELLDLVLEATGLSKERFFIVPGNHDLDRDELKLLSADLLKPLISEPEVQECLTNNRKKLKFLDPFWAFADFVTAYTGQSPSDFANIRILEIDSKKIVLLGLNSAWMCGRNSTDRGFVIVGEPQIQCALEQLSDADMLAADIKIAVLHHPFDWFAEFDRNRIERQLRSKFDFILCGHGHKPKVEAGYSTLGNAAIIPAGASYRKRIEDSPHYTNSYNFVHINFDTGKTAVFLRRWDDELGEWVKDVSSSSNGKFDFNLPNIQANDKSIISLSDELSFCIIPRQIPPPPADFKGRDDEIKDILSNFNKGVTIFGLHGMGGIGKTALALVLAEKLRGKFPDGQLFIDLNGTRENPLSPCGAMGQVIRAFYPRTQIPIDQNELHGLYHSILANKKILLLMDNAANSEQVEPLKPPKGCAMLITSRKKFTLPGMKKKDLKIMPPADSRRMLLEIADRIGDHADILAKLCGNLPLAMRNAASVLAERDDISVEEYVRRLSDELTRLNLVDDASFSLSYDLLSQEQKKGWCLLSIFPSEFDLNGVAAVWNMKPDLAKNELSELVRWSLVEYIPTAQPTDGRYRLHDLARIFAHSRLDPIDSTFAQKNHAKHYGIILSSANDLYKQNGKDTLSGLELFDREWINIQTGHTWAENKIKSRVGGKILVDSDIKSALCLLNTYPIFGTYILRLRLNPQERVRWLNMALVAAQQLDDEESESKHLVDLSWSNIDLCNYNKSIELAKRAIEISRRTSNRQVECEASAKLGAAYTNLGNYQEAIKFSETSLSIARDIGDKRAEGNALTNLGAANINLGKIYQAIEYLENALELIRETEDMRLEGYALINLAAAYNNIGDNHRSIDFLEKALKIIHDIRDRKGECYAMVNLGAAYINTNEFRRSIDLLEQALKIIREIGERRMESFALISQGSAYNRLSEYPEAIKFLEQALKITREIGYKRGEGYALSSLGETYCLLGQNERAVELLEKALTLTRETGEKQVEDFALISLGEVFDQLGNHKKAIQLFDQALKIANEIGDKRAECFALIGLGEANNHLDDNKCAIDLTQQALAIARNIDDNRGKGYALTNLGISNTSLGKCNLAINHFKHALNLIREIEDKREEGKILWYMSLALDVSGKRPEAINQAKSSLEIFEEIKSPYAQQVRLQLENWQN